MSDQHVIDCNDFERDRGFPGCCTSCHEDWDNGWAPPDEGDHMLIGNRPAHVCCDVYHWLVGRGLVQGEVK